MQSTKRRSAPRRANALKQLRAARLRAAAEGTSRPVAFFWDDPELLTVESGDVFEMHFNDMIDDWFGISAAMIVEALIAADGRDVLVHLNSPGGMVTEGLSIHSQFKQYGGKVTMRVEGLAASAASFVMLAADEVLIEPNALIMIHDAWDFTSGPASEHRKTADLLDKISDSIASMYAGKADGDAADWRAAMLEETWYVGQEAVDAGLADALTEDRAAADDSADDAGSAAARTDWRGVFDIAPRRTVDLSTPPPALPESLDHVDLGAVADMTAEWRARQTTPATTTTTGSAIAANHQTRTNWSAFIDQLKGVRS
jgi:ATP-dependent protease ClpP protease subunit